MKSKSFAMALAAILVTAAGLAPEAAWAVPSFARQKNKPCTACHSMWPRLNSAGREFKELGYTDMASDNPRIEKDNLDLLRNGPPLSVSVISFPYAKTSGATASSAIPDEVAIFFAGRITPNFGAFVEPKWARDSGQITLELAKLGAGMKLPSHDTVGLALVKGDATAADPYNTIRFTAYHVVHTPAIFLPDGRSSGGDLFNLSDTENEGLMAGGFFFNTVYGAVGGFRGDGTVADVQTDPLDLYARVALERAFTGELNVSLGGFYYGGKQRYDHTGDAVAGPAYESTFRRYAADLQIQYDAAPHLVDAVAVYLQGKDDKVWDGDASNSDLAFKGYYAELSYFYERQYGVTVGYDHLTSTEDPGLDKKGPTINVTYLPWLNTKLALEYNSFTLTGGEKQRDLTFMIHLYY
jgi:hypothetical protein